MSLDVYLNLPEREVRCCCPHCDFEHTRKERESVYDANITNNLSRMASEAGIYLALWRPEEIGIRKAGQLVEPLRSGLLKLGDDPDHFRQFDASSGWGTYDQFVPWVRRYLHACEEYPEADVEVSR